MNLRTFLPSLIVAGLGITIAAGQARAPDLHNQSLRDLKGVMVVVDMAGTVGQPVLDTPTADQLKASAEARLRKAGINVLSSQDPALSEKIPTLHFTLVTHKDNGGNYYTLRTQLIQEVSLQRDPSIRIEASTWEGGLSGYSAGGKPFERMICLVVSEFVLAYNSVNAPDKLKRLSIAEVMCS